MKGVFKVVLVLVILMVVSGVFGAMLIQHSSLAFVGDYSSFKVNDTQNIELGDSKVIEVDFISSDVSIRAYDGEEVKITYTGTTNAIDELDVPKLIAIEEGNAIKVNVDNIQKEFRIDRLFMHTSTDLEILVPSDYSGNLKMSGVSGEVIIDGLNLEKVEHESVSGNLEVVNGQTSSLDAGTVSGNIDATLGTLTGDVDVDTVSGNTELIIPEDLGYTLHWDSVSGDLSENSDRNAREAEFEINVESVSGNLKIRRLTNE